MKKPTVCCVMLANGREAMAVRAVNAWAAQTYPKTLRVLLILDSGRRPLSFRSVDTGVVLINRPEAAGMTIGALRNNANSRTNAEVLIHWDSDDWSHPRRIEEQVAALEASTAEAVGYRDMLFWNTKAPQYQPIDEVTAIRTDGEAWLYTNRVKTYCLGTSLCYWREVWQRQPFAQTSAGEDTLWLHFVKSQGLCSITDWDEEVGRQFGPNSKPRLIASIHGENTYAKIEPRAEEWKRVPEWDDHCREVMAL